MLKSWIKFNESKQKITKEMIQEVMYYISSPTHLNSNTEIKKIITSTYLKYDENFLENFYEISYAELNKIIDKWTKIANEEKEIANSTIKIYDKIREVNYKFPEIYLIEDEYLEFIDKGLSFDIDIYDGDKYIIRISSWKDEYSLDDFIEILGVNFFDESGLEVNEKEAEEILDFLYIIAKLTVNQYVNGEDIKDI